MEKTQDAVVAEIRDGFLAAARTDFDGAQVRFQKALKTARKQAYRWETARALEALGMLACYQEDEGRAMGFYQESLALFRELDDGASAAALLCKLGNVAEGLALQQRLVDRPYTLQALSDREVAAGAPEGNLLYRFALGLVESALAIRAGDSTGRALVAWRRGNYNRARADLEVSVALGRYLADAYLLPQACSALWGVAFDQGDYDRATAVCEEGLVLCRSLEGRQRDHIPLFLVSLGWIARAQGELDRAKAWCRESLAAARELDLPDAMERALRLRARVALDEGEAAVAAALCDEILALHRKEGRWVFAGASSRDDLAAWLAVRAGATLVLGAPDRAVRLFGAAAALGDDGDLTRAAPPVFSRAEEEENRRHQAAARAALGALRFESEWAAGQAMEPRDAISCALAASGLSGGARLDLTAALGANEEERSFYAEALTGLFGSPKLPPQFPGAPPSRIPSQGSACPAPELVAADTRFSFRLLGELVRRSGDENLLLSPIGIALALQLIANGAGGTTRASVLRGLELQGLDLHAINEGNRALRAALADADPAVRLSIATALWTQLPLSADFLATAAESYGATTARVDFRDPATAGIINDWARRETHGMIPTIVAPPDLVGAVDLLANVVYLKGSWTEPFDRRDTREGAFTLANGTVRRVPMMRGEMRGGYYQEEGFCAVSLPYGEGRITLDLFLPDATDGLPGLLERLDTATWERWQAGWWVELLMLTLPRFDVECLLCLQKPLTALGMGGLFDAGEVDLTPMGPGRRYLTEPRQKTVLDVNEEGTEAAAVFAAPRTSAGPGPRPREVVVDHPFLCVIRDCQTGSLLFIGVIRDPTA